MRGQSELLGWVILLGFAVSLAVVVGGYIKNMASSSTDALVENTENELACRDVFIVLKNTATNEVCKTILSMIGPFILENKGRRTIQKIRVTCGGNSGDSPVNIRPGLNQEINSIYGLDLNSCNSITIIPFIQGDVGCSDKKLKVDCKNG